MQDICFHNGLRRSVFVKASVRAALCWALLVATAADPSNAQKLQKLHVWSFTLSSDTPQPAVERPFHLIIGARFKEPVPNPDELIILPTLGALQIVGDERHATYAKSGTSYTETLTVVAHAAGTVHAGAAHLDAIDARTGKPSRFSSNELVLSVSGAPGDNAAALHRLSVTLAKLALLAFVLFAAVLALRTWRTRHLSPARPQKLPAAVQQEPPNPEPSSLADAVASLRKIRSRHIVFDVRTALRERVGARDGQTLNDLLRDGVVTGEMKAVLRATERAAFIAEQHLPAAIDAMLASLERYAP